MEARSGVRSALVRFGRLFVLAGLTWATFGASCLSDGSDSSSDRGRGRTDSRDTYGDGRTTAGSPRKNVPSTAREVAAGKNQISYRASSAGRVYVTEARYDEVLYEGQIYANEEIVIEPRRNRAYVGNREVMRGRLADDVKYRIFFEPGSSYDRSSGRSDRYGSDRSGSDRYESDRYGSDRYGSDRY